MYMVFARPSLMLKRVLVDTGSEGTIILTDLAETIGINRKEMI
jgi:predicted aspartyl protease